MNTLPCFALASLIGFSQTSPQPAAVAAAVEVVQPTAAVAAVEVVEPAPVAKGATVNWWVTNLASEPAVVTVWKTTRTLKPGERASFAYAIHSKLWVTVKNAKGQQTYAKKHSFDWVPSNHECVVNADLTFRDLGKQGPGEVLDWILKAAAKAAAGG